MSKDFLSGALFATFIWLALEAIYHFVVWGIIWRDGRPKPTKKISDKEMAKKLHDACMKY